MSSATPPAKPARRAFFLGLVAAMLVVLGAAIATATLVLAGDSTAAPTGRQAAAMEPTKAPTVPTTVAPAATTLTDNVPTLDLTKAAPTPRPVVRPPRPIGVPPPPVISASAAPEPPPSAAPTAPPRAAPSSTAFNPEAM